MVIEYEHVIPRQVTSCEYFPMMLCHPCPPLTKILTSKCIMLRTIVTLTSIFEVESPNLTDELLGKAGLCLTLYSQVCLAIITSYTLIITNIIL